MSRQMAGEQRNLISISGRCKNVGHLQNIQPDPEAKPASHLTVNWSSSPEGEAKMA